MASTPLSSRHLCLLVASLLGRQNACVFDVLCRGTTLSVPVQVSSSVTMRPPSASTLGTTSRSGASCPPLRSIYAHGLVGSSTSIRRRSGRSCSACPPARRPSRRTSTSSSSSRRASSRAWPVSWHAERNADCVQLQERRDVQHGRVRPAAGRPPGELPHLHVPRVLLTRYVTRLIMRRPPHERAPQSTSRRHR